MSTVRRQTGPLTTPYSVEAVPSNAIDDVWPHVLPMVERGLRHGEGDTITSEHVRQSILAGEMHAWAVRDAEGIAAVLIFRVRMDAAGRSLFVVMLAGRDMSEWIDELEEMLMDYRDIIGARCIRASCRLGLARKLAERGWAKKSVIMEAPK